MKLWRMVILILVVAALALLVSASIFNWHPMRAIRPAIPQWQRPELQFSHFRPSAPLGLLGALFTFYLCGVMLLYLFPGHVGRIARAFTRSPGSLLRMGLLGLLVGLLVAIAGLSSALAMSTFPLTLFLGMGLFLGSLLGMIALAYQIGRTLLERAGCQASPLVALLLGEMITFALLVLPVAGVVIVLVLASLGLGATIATRFGSGHPWSLISLTEEGKE